MKNDLGDTGEALLEDKKFSETGEALLADKKFLKDSEKNCAEKQKLFDENVKIRGQELAALQATMPLSSSKTLPGAFSFSQEQVTQQDMANKVFACQKAARNPKLDFIALAVKGKKAGFEKVIKLIDDLTAEFKNEQVDDDSKKEHCEA